MSSFRGFQKSCLCKLNINFAVLPAGMMQLYTLTTTFANDTGYLNSWTIEKLELIIWCRYLLIYGGFLTTMWNKRSNFNGYFFKYFEKAWEYTVTWTKGNGKSFSRLKMGVLLFFSWKQEPTDSGFLLCFLVWFFMLLELLETSSFSNFFFY